MAGKRSQLLSVRNIPRDILRRQNGTEVFIISSETGAEICFERCFEGNAGIFENVIMKKQPTTFLFCAEACIVRAALSFNRRLDPGGRHPWQPTKADLDQPSGTTKE